MLVQNLSNSLEISKIQKKQIYSNSEFETLIVSIEEGMEIAPQPAPANAGLYMIHGKVEFTIDGKIQFAKTDDFFSFEKNQMHGLKAIENSRFIISRVHV